ncbi:MAG: alanine racemase, partial [Bacteroidales bacterium]|nr:alanine racemase [Bacteroidales bacterium]
MMREDDFSRLELNLGACERNYRYFRSLLQPSTKLLVLVKANAYGHGAVEFASMMQRAGADYLAVAYPVEGLELRQNGISLPIIVLTSGTDFFPEMIERRLEPSIPNLYALEVLCGILREKGISDYPVHIKLDTGMHRLGFMASELPALTSFLQAHPEVRVQSMFSHLCVAEDPSEDEFTRGQFDLFEKMSSGLIREIGYTPLRHILNSAGIERFPEHQYDMVRL